MDYPKSDPSARLHQDKFTDGDPVNGVLASRDSAKYQNMVFDELINLIKGAGLTEKEDQFSQVLAAVRNGGRPAKPFADNDYSELPGGLIIQFGAATWNGESSSIYFSIAFPTKCLAVVPVAEFDNGSVAINNRQRTHFGASALNAGSNAVGTHNYSYIAIGF